MTIHKWLVGLFLAFIMVSALGVNAMLFSARNFQFELAQLAPNTKGIIDVQALLDAETQVKAIKDRNSGTSAALTQAQQQLDALNDTLARAEADLNTKRAEVTGDLARIETEVGVAAPASAALMDSHALDARLAMVAQRGGISADHQQRLAALRGQVSQVADLEASVSSRDADRAALVSQVRLLSGQTSQTNEQIIAIQQGVLPANQFESVLSEIHALDRFSIFGIGRTLVGLPPTFMSTILVLQMGLLGAILYLFPAYMSRPNPVTFAEIAVRMIFGMCTALAFYVVANATLAGFTFIPPQSDQTSLTPSSSINPFTVSLIGIVAGVMADDIARWLRRRGGELFGAAPDAVVATPAATSTAPVAQPAVVSNPEPVNIHGGPING